MDQENLPLSSNVPRQTFILNNINQNHSYTSNALRNNEFCIA